MKTNKSNKANKTAALQFVAIGSKGVVGVFGTPAKTGESLSVRWYGAGAQAFGTADDTATFLSHSKGQPAGVAFRDSGAYVSRKSESFAVLPLAAALKSGQIRPVSVVLRDGRTVRAFAHKRFDVAGKCTAENFGQFFATADLPSRRVDNLRVRGGRNASTLTPIKTVTLAK